MDYMVQLEHICIGKPDKLVTDYSNIEYYLATKNRIHRHRSQAVNSCCANVRYHTTHIRYKSHTIFPSHRSEIQTQVLPPI